MAMVRVMAMGTEETMAIGIVTGFMATDLAIVIRTAGRAAITPGVSTSVVSRQNAGGRGIVAAANLICQGLICRP